MDPGESHPIHLQGYPGMKHTRSLIIFVALLLVGCAPAALPAQAPLQAARRPVSDNASVSKTLNVFAAASLSNAFPEIGRDFEAANPGTTVSFNFAGSQALRTQIEEGAPADVFASANKTEMDALITDNLVAPDAPRQFLSNKLVVILPANNPAGLEKLADLTRPGIKLVLAAEEVPVGKYARQALDNMNNQFGNDFKDKVLANVASNEDNVKQVVAKVQLGEADAGIVYTSDAVAAPDLKTIEIPAGLNVIAQYPIAPLVKSENNELAKAFITYLLSPDGQAVLQKWGFASPQ
jgi:molybdate transport system substrate-binding protein